MKMFRQALKQKPAASSTTAAAAAATVVPKQQQVKAGSVKAGSVKAKATTTTTTMKNESKMSGIINAHKPLPLSELFSPGAAAAAEAKKQQEQQEHYRTKRMQFTRCIMGIILLLLLFLLQRFFWSADPMIPSPDLWMKDPLTISLLTKTPKTKNNMYTVFVTLYTNHNNNNDDDDDDDDDHVPLQVRFGQSDQSAELAMRHAYQKIQLDHALRKHLKKQKKQKSTRQDENHNHDHNHDHNDHHYYWIKVDAVQVLESISDFHYDTDGIPLHSGFGIGQKDWHSMVFLHDEVIGSALVANHPHTTTSTTTSTSTQNNNNNNENENAENINKNNNNNNAGRTLRWDHIGKQWAKKKNQHNIQLLSSLRTPSSTTLTSAASAAAAASPHAWPTEINVEDSTVSIDFFRTQAIFYDGSTRTTTIPTTTTTRSTSSSSAVSAATATGGVVPLVKGRRVLAIAELTPDYLRHHAVMAGEYLARQVHPNGSHSATNNNNNNSNMIPGTMVYRYRPRSDTEPREEYNLTRHAGTVYAMAVLYKVYKSPQLLQAIHASLDYLVHPQIMVDCPLAYPSDISGSDEMTTKATTKRTKCIVNEVYHGHPWTQLGVNALALLAMAEYMDATQNTERYWQSANDLATWIEATQHDDGSFVQDQDIDTGLLDEESYVRYYPGEAAFAMARLYNVATTLNLKPKDSWKAVASNAMDYIVDRESDVEDDDFVNDHWMMYALAEMAPWHWTKEMLDFALRTGRVAQERQVRHHDNVMDQDRNGIYIHKSGEDMPSLSSCATATKSEGLCAVYPVIQKHAPDRATMFLDSVKWGIRYQLGAQIRPEQAMYMKKPHRAVGAFAKNIVETETRNDYTQHNLASLLCLARVLDADNLDVAGASAIV